MTCGWAAVEDEVGSLCGWRDVADDCVTGFAGYGYTGDGEGDLAFFCWEA